MLHARISGLASYAPDDILDNEMLSKMVDTNDEWITTRVGIKERRILREPGKGSSYLGIKAVEKLLERTGTKPEEVDLLICATSNPDYRFPSTGSVIAHQLGLKNAYAYDVQAACAGFLVALEDGSAYVRSGLRKKVVVVAAEKMSSMTNYQDRATCPLFGDGAGAAVVGRGDAMKTVRLTTSSRKEVLYQVRRLEPTPYLDGEREFAPLVMKGRDVFKTAVSSSTADIKAMLAETGIDPSQVKYYVLHQANERIIDSIRGLLGEQPEKFPHNVERYGNTSSASVPILLDEMSRAGKLSKGDILVMSAFGAGFTTAGCILEWTK